MKTIVSIKPQSLITSKKAKQPPRRTKYDIWIEIIESCAKMRRTRFWLNSRLRLSWKVVDESLRFLTTAELIEASGPRGKETIKYKTTAKGKEALNVYRLLVETYFYPH